MSMTLCKKSIVIIMVKYVLQIMGWTNLPISLLFNAIAKRQSKWKFSSLTQFFTPVWDHRTFFKLLLDECRMQCCRGDVRTQE